LQKSNVLSSEAAFVFGPSAETISFHFSAAAARRFFHLSLVSAGNRH
jgi:hypothetical protein